LVEAHGTESDLTPDQEPAARGYRVLQVGEPGPWFVLRSGDNPIYHLDAAAGRYLLLGFVGSAADEGGQRMLQLAARLRRLFDDERIAFFGVSVDPADERRLKDSLPGVRFFWDFQGEASRLYGALAVDAHKGPAPYVRKWVVLDPDMRVRKVLFADPSGAEHEELAAFLRSLPPVDLYPGLPVQTPVITLRDVLEPELCRQLVDLHRTGEPTESGVMKMLGGRTVGVINHDFKSRRDVMIEDEALRLELQKRVSLRVLPELLKVCQFRVTRMERYLVACYDAAARGHFAAHRDNTTSGTAHRRFAMSINLNDDYDGGEVCFPEYGRRTFKAPPGGAVVFSCSLLHAVTPVTRGKRYVFLPFFYDEAAAAEREANNGLLAEHIEPYSMHAPAEPEA
jgi:predicted 2-oxoglutarate/Fe(II)-dependent dioxygenase YbiX/peroxiredoxin